MKVDLKKSDDAYRARRGEFRVLEVPNTRYLAVAGSGDPNTAPAYRAALEALYPFAYALKFAARDALGRDHVVPPWIPSDVIDVAREKAGDRSRGVELRTLMEGTCVQTLHVGSFDDEGPVIEAMHSHALADGYRLTGTHHEIYLSDPRRTAPERLRTILRQPVAVAL